MGILTIINPIVYIGFVSNRLSNHNPPNNAPTTINKVKQPTCPATLASVRLRNFVFELSVAGFSGGILENYIRFKK
jgi:hypothetical protein